MSTEHSAEGAESTDSAIQAYAGAVRRLLAHGGFERSGDPAEARRWDIAHITAYLDAHGRPDARRTVHVAGTKGKGSTATMTESILRAAGAHTLLLISPDLHQARERIAIDGAPVGYAQFAALAERVLADPASERWSYFELLTVMGWHAGADAGCDWQVLEVGLGGRLDTTNAVAAKQVAVITPIDLEHTAILGETIALIAAEKAGIITTPCEVVAAPMRESALDVVRARTVAAGATLHQVAEECTLRVSGQTLDGQKLDLRTPLRTYRGLSLPLAGPHQAQNAAAATRAAELAFAATAQELPERAVHEGLARTRLHARFEVLKRRPLVVIDAAHTALAAKRFRQTVEALPLPAQCVLVVGLLAGKDTRGIAAELSACSDTVIVAPPASPRAADPREVARAFSEAGAIAQTALTIAQAIEVASAIAGERGAVLVVGGLYAAAEAREHLLAVTGDRALGLR
ncbi:MAG: hypothetical protein EXR65_01775 [Dehalococcoidia bacterium]|nr:hypothetical protein [Dehalococcoidia bacterium]